MTEIPVADLRVSDIGSRAIVIDTSGNAYDGSLTSFFPSQWKYGKTEADMVRTNLTLEAGEKSKLELGHLPLDFRVQIERDIQEGEPT